MEEGEPGLGGIQTNPGDTQVSNIGPQPIVSSAPQPIQPQPHFTSAQPISSGTGDIILNNSEQKNSKKPLIIAIVAILVVALMGVGVYFLISKGDIFGSSSKKTDISKSKEAFNSYVNYILSGKDSTEDVEEGSWDGEPYFITIKASDISSYVATANEKFKKLYEIYNNNSGKYDIVWLKSFYQDAASTFSLTDSDIIKTYLSEGVDAAEKLIEEKYDTSDSNEYLDAYMFAGRQLAKSKLNMFVAAQAQGCLWESSVLECYTPTEEDMKNQSNLVTSSFDALNNLSFEVSLVLDSVFEEIYYGGESENSL